MMPMPAVSVEVESVRLRGGQYDGLDVVLPVSAVKVCLESAWYYRTHRRTGGQAQFTHSSIWGRI